MAPLVSGVDGDSSGGLDVLHSRLGNAEVARVLLLGGDGPPPDLGHHGPHVTALVADVLECIIISFYFLTKLSTRCRELFRGVAKPGVLCHKEPARASKAPY